MGVFDRIAEKKIAEAILDGVFENLPGAGKPFRLEDNPHEPEGWGAAFLLLKNNGFTLPWIADREEIERERQNLFGRDLDRQAFDQQIGELNARILRYNLQAPSPAFQRAPLDSAAEWKAAQALRSSPHSSEP